MTKARFYISDKVQEVGYRPLIMEKILNSDLEGTAKNLPDGRVEVLLEGEKEKIEAFFEEIKKEKPEHAENPTFSKLTFDETLFVPKAMRSSQALMLGQLGKGVDVLIMVGDDIKSMGDDIKNMDEAIRDMSADIRKLPERIAEAIRK
ncbi:MAG: acylphosphatase [Methanocellales archaeon]|nr:acylphosphatase [Methanocellales archaeon]